MNIWILGIDGSGKTTQAKEILTRLKRLPCRYYHLEGPPILKYFPIYSKIRKHSVSTKAKIKKHGHEMLFWLIVTGIDNILDSIFKIRMNGILVQDRIFYQNAIEFFDLAPKWMMKIYLRTLRKPNLVFFIDIDPETARKRKGEQDVEFLNKQKKNLNIVLKLLDKKKVIKIDGTLEKNEISRFIVNKIMESIKND